MYSRFLTALDGSKHSERILPCARLFSRGLKLPVELLVVIDPETLMASETGGGRHRETLLAERKKTAALYLKNIAGTFPAGLRVDCAVEVGKPAEVIADRAATDIATLIAIGTHGRSGVQRWLLGSVADKVLHAARNPLLLVRTTEETQSIETAALKSILVPLDGSELAESVLPPCNGAFQKDES